MSDDENLFKDYCKAENTDDEENNNDLQARLYAEIYYASNIIGESEIDNTSRITQHNNMVDESTIEQNMQHEHEDKELPESEIDRGSLVCNDTSCAQSSTNLHASTDIQEFHLTGQIKSITDRSVQTNRDIDCRHFDLTDQETIHDAGLLSYSNSVVHEYDDTNHEISVESIAIEGKERKQSFFKKHRLAKLSKNKHQKRSQKDNTVSIHEDMDTKYNVSKKKEKQKTLVVDEQNSEESSSSDESIFEVPVPPKPQPPLINLQDSDEENSTSPAIENDDLWGKSCDKDASKNVNSRISTSTSPDLEIVEVSFSRQDILSKNKSTNKSKRNKYTSMKHHKGVCTRSHVHNVNEDIVLNCTTVQKGARNINEIKQSSKSAGMEQYQGGASTEHTRENSEKETPQNIEDNVYIPQGTYVSPGRKSPMKKTRQYIDTYETSTNYNVDNVVRNHKRAGQDLMDGTLVEVSCGNSYLVVNRKRYSNSGEGTQDSPALKRQCIPQHSVQNAISTPQDSSSGRGEVNIRRNESSCEYFFKPMPEKLKRFYNDSRGQENFDIREVQRGMSRDPRIWKILDEDLMPSPASRRSGRYWTSARCSYCQRDGHLRKDCPEPPRPPRCYMCGTQGHTEKRCPRKMCLTCGKKQSTFRKTCEYCRTLYCTMCNSAEHTAENCPDLWRRYHQTTKEIDFIPRNSNDVMKPANQLHCCNCTKRGHEASTCKEYRWSQHYFTPAAVTNYTDGPMYASQAIPGTSIEIGTETTDISSPTTKNIRISIPQRSKNTPEVEEYAKRSPNALLANATAVTPGFACVSEMAGNSVPFLNMNKSPYKVREMERMTQRVQEITFHRIIYCCDNFYDRKNKNARMIVRNISHDKNLSSHGKRFILGSLAERKVTPIFLHKLQEIMEFKVTIGFGKDKFGVTLQVIALEDCVYPLYDLLFYWLNLQQDEKDYGLDVSLPTNPTEMLDLLNFRMLEIKNKEFRNPLKLLRGINDLKTNFSDQERTRLCQLQLKLLKIVNTRPKSSIHIHDLSRYLDKLTQVQTSDQLDSATYLQIVLNYNHLFVPHTPLGVTDMVNRIVQQKKDDKKAQKKKKQDLACSTNANPSIPLATSYTLQDINYVGNPSTFSNIQDFTDDMPVDVQDVNDTWHGVTNETENCIQYPENVSLTAEPVSVQLDPGREEAQLAINSINVKSNVCIVEPNINAKHIKDQKPMSKKARRKLRKAMQKKMEEQAARRNPAESGKAINQDLHERAKEAIKQARALKLSHMMKAADNLQRKINNQTLHQNHLSILHKLIKLEKRYTLNMSRYHSYLE